MITFIIVVHAIVSILLIGIVLLQSTKGAGFADVFGMGGMGQSLFGAQTGNFITRMTTVLAVVFMITSLSLAFFAGTSKKSVVDKIADAEVSVEQEMALPKEEEGLAVIESTPAVEEKLTEQELPVPVVEEK